MLSPFVKSAALTGLNGEKKIVTGQEKKKL
jgi:hypothetical protein